MIQEFALNVSIEHLSHKFRAYLPGFSMPARAAYRPNMHAIAVCSRQGLFALDYMNFGYWPEEIVQALGARSARVSYPFARAEQVEVSRLYAKALQSGWRCVVPVNHFVPMGRAERLEVHLLSTSIFALAGLYNLARSVASEQRSFALLTTVSAPDLKTFPRMPMSLEVDECAAWIKGRMTIVEAASLARKRTYRLARP